MHGQMVATAVAPMQARGSAMKQPVLESPGDPVPMPLELAPGDAGNLQVLHVGCDGPERHAELRDKARLRALE